MTGIRPLPAAYEFVRPLGAGAYGEVVLARQRSLDRLVAIKRIRHFALTDADARERFRREGTVLARLSCPSIVTVYDFVVDDAGALLVMEFVDGPTLADHIANGSLPFQAAVGVLADVADALTSAGRANVIHRDVKPGNVFVLRNGRAKLGDFGLARVVADPSIFRTASATVAGTPAYLPPEVSQRGVDPDERSDAYSFAVMAFEVLTGTRPFDGDDALAVIAAHWSKTPPRADQLVPGLPPAAANALEHGLARDPARRLLPAQLAGALRSIPASEWPAQRPNGARHSPVPPEGSTRIAPPSSVPLPLPPRSAPSAPPRLGPQTVDHCRSARGCRRRGGRGCCFGCAHRPPPQRPSVQSASVVVDPLTGRCPRHRFTFQARVVTNGASGQPRGNVDLSQRAAPQLSGPRGQSPAERSYRGHLRCHRAEQVERLRRTPSIGGRPNPVRP